VDERRDAVKLIRENLKATDLSDRGEVIQSDATSYLTRTNEKFHLVFLDPPYDTGLLDSVLKKLAVIDILADNAIIICESRVEKQLPVLPEPFVKSKDYRYGKIKVTLYRKEG
jgi:16S rRNA G966 N2-methylase RsmD